MRIMHGRRYLVKVALSNEVRFITISETRSQINCMYFAAFETNINGTTTLIYETGALETSQY